MPDPENWSDAPNPFRGLVVGAVQSGKTASMIGLTAMAIDQGYRIVVVLSGSKDDLRRQTARRFDMQLLRRSELIPDGAGARTLDPGEEANALPAFHLPYHRDAHLVASFHLALQHALERGQPAIIVIKKHTRSLAEVRRKLEIGFQRLGVAKLPMLVLDDECDDASVDREDMAIPTAIAGLWRRAGDHPFVAYVGYTATSAANLLQNQDNELFPRDFAYLLRYPSNETTSLSFEEPSPDSWYTGGSTYYEAFGDEPGPEDNFLVAASVTAQQLVAAVSNNESLLDAARAFVVSGGYRLALAPAWNLDDPANFPRPHTMLVQTSSAQAEHRVWLDALSSLFGHDRVREGVEYRWPVTGVLDDIRLNEATWKRWYDEFGKSRIRVLEDRPRVSSGGMASWEAVKGSIPSFVQSLRLKVVNSDDEIGSDLDFQPRVLADGKIVRPKDVFVIVIGGAKLSRGLTIDGLCTTYFTRWNPSPTEDTVLQLSRWYGYRGPHLEFCRLFTTPDIYSELRDMEENDFGLREELARLMRERLSPADAAIVISSNPRALPTAKLGQGKLYDLAFSPFATVLRIVESADANLQMQNEQAAAQFVERVKSREPERVVAASGADRGIVSREWSATEVAEVFESLRYRDHNPSASGNPAREYFRRPDADRPIVSGRNVTDDPYQIAAYLREWAARGDAPTFNVGVAWGEIASASEPFDFPLVNREITGRGEVVGGWTGRRAGWRGDQLFDGARGNPVAPATIDRPTGAPGLLLLYMIHKDARGRHKRGAPRPSHTPMLGIVIPNGGPIWRRVTVDRRRVVES